jgi:hypothetical protein
MGRVEELSFNELVQELAHYEHDVGGERDLEKAIRRRSVDARLMRLIGSDAPADERRSGVRVPGEIPVKLHDGERPIAATIVDLAEGGLRVKTEEAAPESATIEVELPMDEANEALRANARVAWKKQLADRFELGLSFVAIPEMNRRRMRRLVIELLRRMPDPLAAAK